jgi:hypothetical protein
MLYQDKKNLELFPGKNDIIERVHLKICKLPLHVKTSTPNFMVYGELGRYPIDIDIKVRMISTKLFLATNFNHLSEIQFCMFQIYDIPQSFKIQRILFNQAHVKK